MPTRDSVPFGGLRTEDDAYRRALGRFLAGTDEKTHTHAYLDDLVRHLPARRAFLDVGPADGTTTAHLAAFFDRTIGIEPSEPMRRVLQRACPEAHVIADPVLIAEPVAAVDLALLSHVLYYIPRSQWIETVSRVLEWVASGGALVVLLQSADDPCMAMVRHFTGARFDLRAFAGELASSRSDVTVDLDVVPARFDSGDLEDAVDAAIFHLSVASDPPGKPFPDRDAVRAYVRREFADPSGGFTMRHDQDVLIVRRPSS